MRAPAALAALAACALACSVATDGAPCSDDGNCPRGQFCGPEGRCGATRRPLTCESCAAGEKRCGASSLETCSASASTLPDGGACNVWKATPCASGLACGGTAAAPACVCPDPGAALAVDRAAGSAATATPRPTGAASPPSCRFKTLADALAAATAIAARGTPATVTATGFSGATMLFSETAKQLSIPSGVTLAASQGLGLDANPPSIPYAIESRWPIQLHDGAALSGFLVRPAADGIDAVDVVCGPGATAAALVDGAAFQGADPTGKLAFAVGVNQLGCPTTIRRTTFDAVATAVQSTTGGALVVDGCSIGGGGRGVVLDASGSAAAAFDATIQNSQLTGGSDTAVYVNSAPAGSRVRLLGNVVTGNCATTPVLVTGGTRRAGGIVLTGTPPAVTMHGNQVYANGYDQVLVANTSGAVDLTGDATAANGKCPAFANANQFTCPDATHRQLGGPSYGVYSSGATVNAAGNYWSAQPPSASADYAAPAVKPLGTGAQACGASSIPCPAANPCP